MNTLIASPTSWLGFVLLTASTFGQAAGAPENVLAATNATLPTDGAASGLRFNFRGAPLETVLNYMSEAAGFVIVLETPVRGTVDMWSTQPVSKVEAVQLLNLALNKNGYTATVQGRNLIVNSKDEAKKRNLPIRTGNNPRDIPENASMVMQIIPLRHINAMQASRDLATLLPGSATLTANEDSNSLVVTDTQMNVRHIVELVAALDTSADTVSSMRVFKLNNADPVEMAQLLTNVFQSTVPTAAARAGGNRQGNNAQRGNNNNNRTNNNRGGNNRSGSGSGSGSGPTGGDRGTPVVAVADPRTFSVIVTAATDAMPEIAEMIAQLDSSSARKQKVFVYTMENAEVKQVEAVLKNLFQSSNSRASPNTQPDPLTTRATSNAQNSGSNITLGANRGTSR